MSALAGPLAVTLGPDGLWWSNVGVLVAIYALLALALNLINGYARMFSLGHHGFWALGAYGAAWFTRAAEGHAPGGLAAHLHAAAGSLGGWMESSLGWGGSAQGWVVFAASAVAAMAVACLGGLVIGVPCLRLRGDYLAIATLGFGEIVRIAIQNTDEAVLGGSVGLEVPRVLMEVTRKTKGDFRILWVVLSVAAVLLTALLVRNLIRSARGRTLLAVAQDETAAALMGIDPTRSKVGAFLLGSTLAGLAGALYAHYQGTITPLDFSFMEMVKIFLIVVLGGRGSISGCLTAAFLILFVEQSLLVQGQERLPFLVPHIPDLPAVTWGSVQILPHVHWADVWQILFALVLILLMIFRPHGLFGSRELPQVLASGARSLVAALGGAVRRLRRAWARLRGRGAGGGVA